MKKLLYILLISFVIFGCAGEDGSNGDNGVSGTNGEDGNTGDVGQNGDDGNNGTNSDSSSDDQVRYALNGKAENGPCKKPGSILVYPLDSDLYQTGNPVFGYINDNTGSFGARGTATGEWAFYVAENLTCYNEVSAGYDTGIQFFSLTDLTSSERNLNPLTTIEYLVAIDYFDDVLDACYQNINCAVLNAHDNILSFFGMPTTNTKFSEMTLQGNTSADAILTIIDSMIANGRDATEQNSYMLDIAEGVLNNDLTLKSSVAAQIGALPIKTIKTNLETVYTELGVGPKCPPIWELPFLPNYYNDILTRDPEILESFNLDSTSTCTFDTTGYDSFAYPIVFSSIENAVYFASELGGDLSIWSVGTCNQGTEYFCPLTEIFSIQELNEILLEPSLIYNGFLGQHGLINSEQYFVVQNFDDLTHTPSHACDGSIIPFGRILAAIDNNWEAAIGWNNTTSFFRRAPKVFITN